MNRTVPFQSAVPLLAANNHHLTDPTWVRRPLISGAASCAVVSAIRTDKLGQDTESYWGPLPMREERTGGVDGFRPSLRFCPSAASGGCADCHLGATGWALG